jgi:hypothetical protein
MNKQLDFSFMKDLTDKVKATVRFGKVPKIVTMHDVDKIIGPRGDGAVDAYERGILSPSEDFEDSGEYCSFDCHEYY